MSIGSLVSVLLSIALLNPIWDPVPMRAPAVEMSEPQGEYVAVFPLVGRSFRPIRKYLTTAERLVLDEIQQRINTMKIGDPTGDAPVVWHVEKSASYSVTYRLQIRVLYALRGMLEGVDGFTSNTRLDIVVARTQSFIGETLKELNCDPDLSQFGGQILMGAALCNRRIIVTNLSGYMFLIRKGDLVTPLMETRPEPLLRNTSYKLVSRNMSALAHEWMHYFRAAGLGGRVAPDEPVWFSEGFAEFWAGIAKVRAYGGADALMRYHVVRLRDFYDWARKCPGSLSQYRVERGTTCEYHLGTLAIEYLVANYGGLEKTAEAFRFNGRITSFAQGFELLFGISLADFEAEADRYIETIRKAELTK